MSKGIIGVDVDLTVVDILRPWQHWLESITGRQKMLPLDNIRYDVSSYFGEELKTVGRDGLDFFRQTGLYDLLRPRDHAVDVLQDFHNLGYEVVFISAIKGGHSKSKAEFIKRFFPFYNGIVFTKEKQYISCDAFIDDRNIMLNKVDAKVIIKYNTPYQQEVDLKVGVHVADNWAQVDRILYKSLIEGKE